MSISIFHIYTEGQSEYHPATLRDRIIAQLIDGVILGVLTSLVLWVFSSGQLYSVWISPMVPVYLLQVVEGHVVDPSHWWWGGYFVHLQIPYLSDLNLALPAPLQWAYYALYYTYFHTYFGQTPGKMMKGLVLLDLTAHKITFRKSALRWVGYSFSLLPLGLGFWVSAQGVNKKTWHDRLADTQVYRFIELR